jgi:hypothetical protein
MIVAVVVVLGLAFAGQYSNFRVAAVEQPGIQQRALWQDGLEHGVLFGTPAGTTIYMTERDMNWSPLGNVIDYPDAADYFTFLYTGRKFDVRSYGQTASVCGPPQGFPIPDCATPSHNAGLLAIRASIGGGEAILGYGVPASKIGTVSVRQIAVVARGVSARGAKPSLVGTTAHGKPWAASQANWVRLSLPGGWTRYTTTISGRGRGGPTAPSLTDPRSPVDFSVPTAPGQEVRWFGTKNLLP